MNLRSDDFTLLGLPQRFALDTALLEQRWKDLQRQAHPDRFVHEGAAAQRVAMQWSVRINEAYERLKDPVRRASVLCELAGVPIQAHTNTAMPAAFLMEQMQWREALDDAHTLDDVEQLHATVLQAQRAAVQRLQSLLDEAQDAQQAAQQVRALMFIDKFLRDLDRAFEQYE
ncbi:MAG: Fe-S protein assembly co-chaperone HscB [Rhodoferax sp.]